MAQRLARSLVALTATLLSLSCLGIELRDAELPQALETQYRAHINVQTDAQADKQSADRQKASPPPIVAGSFTTLIPRIPKNWRASPNRSRPQLLNDLLMPLGIEYDDSVMPALSDFWLDDPESHTLFVHLHPKAQWSNGIPVTTRDVIYTLFQQSDLHSGTLYSNARQATLLTGVTRFDESYFALHYSQKFDNAPKALFNLRPLPAHAFGQSQRDIPAVNGPYRIDSASDDQITLLRIPEWWGNSVEHFKDRFLIRQIIMKPANREQFKAFKQGQIDCIASVSRTTSTTPWLDELLETKKITHIISHMKPPLSVWLASPERVTKEVAEEVIEPETGSEAEFQQLHKQLKALSSGQTNEAPVVDLIFNAGSSFEWASRAGYSPLSPSDLKSRIRTGFYDAAAVTLPGGLTSAEARNVIQSMSIEKRPLNIAALYDIPYYHYACWPWVTLPEPSTAGGDILSPINLSDGGHIGIDRRQRARTLGRPNRGKDEQPTTVYYPAPQTQTKQ